VPDVPDELLLSIPLAALALVAVFGFVGCTKDFDELIVVEDGEADGPNGAPAPLPYADEVMSSSPIAYWRLSDPPGSNLAKDEIGSPPSGDHPGTYQGSVTLGQAPGLNLSDPNATATHFDGTGFVEVAHDAAFEMSQFTVEALVHPDSVVALGIIVGNVLSSGGWALTIQPRSPGDHPDIDGFIAPLVSDGSGLAGPPAEPIELVKLGAFWHLAMTFDGTVLTLYWDGVKRAWGSFPYAPNTQDALQIGLDCKGAIQEVAVYNAALTAEQITTHYLANTSPGS
jgi:Concanavalin A-like lectin/glucanases superfamily